MPKKKAQKRTETDRGDTRQRILDAAIGLFARNGFVRTTTRVLAEAAGVTEMTLFRHFSGKEALFEAVVEQYGGKVVNGELKPTLTGRYREDMLRLGAMFMGILKERSATIRMVMCEASHFPSIAASLAQNPRRMRRMLAEYLQQQIEAGIVRPVDPEAAANAFWGMFMAYRIGTDWLAEPGVGGASDEEVVRHFVDIFVGGTAAGEGTDGNRD
jgi:TetR/AcrR family transcriptional repressor of mexJK operon